MCLTASIKEIYDSQKLSLWCKFPIFWQTVKLFHNPLVYDLLILFLYTAAAERKVFWNGNWMENKKRNYVKIVYPFFIIFSLEDPKNRPGIWVNRFIINLYFSFRRWGIYLWKCLKRWFSLFLLLLFWCYWVRVIILACGILYGFFFQINTHRKKLSVEGFLVNGFRLNPNCNIFMSFLFVFR